MEFVLDILKYARDLFVIFISGLTIVRSLRGQRFQWGLSPKGPQAPPFLMRTWLLFGGTYAMWWSGVQFGLDSHLITGRSSAATSLAFVTNHIGRIVVHLFLIVTFAVFGVSIARTNRTQASATKRMARYAAVFLAAILVLANLIVLLRPLFSL
jgi:hypothetical protein